MGKNVKILAGILVVVLALGVGVILTQDSDDLEGRLSSRNQKRCEQLKEKDPAAYEKRCADQEKVKESRDEKKEEKVKEENVKKEEDTVVPPVEEEEDAPTEKEEDEISEERDLPSNDLTREAYLQMLFDMENIALDSTILTPCPDVAADSLDLWGMAEQLGIISPYSTGLCGPDSLITRAEGAQILANYGDLVLGTVPIISPTSSTFVDVPTSVWFYSSVESLNAVGVPVGLSNGLFEPGDILQSPDLESWILALPSTVSNPWSITVAPSDNPVLDDVAVAGADAFGGELHVANYKIYANGQPAIVDKLTLENDSAADNVSENDGAIETVVIKYPTSFTDSTTLDGLSATVLVGGMAHFTGLDIAVPESFSDENAVEVQVYVVTFDTSTGTVSGDQIELDFNEGETFRAIGQTTGDVITEASPSSEFLTTVDVDSYETALYKSVPTFAKDTSVTAPCPTTNLVASSSAEIYCFKVTAAPQGDIGLYKVTLDATPANLDLGALSAANGWSIYAYDSSGMVIENVLGYGTWAANSVAMAFDNEEIIPAGTDNYYVVRAPIGLTSIGGGALSVRLAAETSFSHAAPTYASNVSPTKKNVWSDRSALSHSLSTNDWMDSYKLENLPSAYLQLIEAVPNPSTPVFSKHNSATSVCPTSNLVATSSSPVYCLQVQASGGSDPVTLNSLTFQATPTSSTLNLGELSNPNGWELYSYDSSSVINYSTVLGQGTWSSNEVTINLATPELIPSGDTYYYLLQAPISFDSNRIMPASIATRLESVDSVPVASVGPPNYLPTDFLLLQE